MRPASESAGTEREEKEGGGKREVRGEEKEVVQQQMNTRLLKLTLPKKFQCVSNAKLGYCATILLVLHAKFEIGNRISRRDVF